MKPKDLLDSLERTDRTMDHLSDKEPQESNVIFDYGNAPSYNQWHTMQQYSQQLGQASTGSLYEGMGLIPRGPIVYR